MPIKKDTAEEQAKEKWSDETPVQPAGEDGARLAVPVNIGAFTNNIPKAFVFRLTSVTPDNKGVGIVSNGFFHDGLFTSEEDRAKAFEGLGAANLTTNQSIARKKANTWRPLIQQFWQQGFSPEEAFLRAYFNEGKQIYDFLAPLRQHVYPMGQVSVEGSALAKTEAELTLSMQAIDALFGEGERALVKLPNIQGRTVGISSNLEDGVVAT